MGFISFFISAMMLYTEDCRVVLPSCLMYYLEVNKLTGNFVVSGVFKRMGR